MSGSIPKTGERLIPEKCGTEIEYLLYLRHLFAYRFVREQVRPDTRVLEVGCGEGYGTSYLSPAVEKIIGLDVDENTVAYAGERYGSENCVFESYDGKRIPYGDGTFDYVVSFQVIEHVENVPGYLEEIFRVLKEGGTFFLTTPNRTYRLRPGQKPWNKFHRREYYPRDLERVLRKVFREAEVWGIRGNREVQKIEKDRVKQGSILSYYFLRAVKLLPQSLRSRFGRKKVGRARPEGGTEDRAPEGGRDFNDRYSLDDYYLIRTGVRESLDLLGICRK
ncbi:MAG: class I SAM-dependent methyltransferase [Candidatus Krumholzibacteriota bacterium]|nr:class I SAM-dependent methyltransferase [Candidatus Krumholzibacteriota bacterium]